MCNIAFKFLICFYYFSGDRPATLSNTSDDDSSEYEAPTQHRRISSRAGSRPSKLAQLRAKIQRRKTKGTKSKLCEYRSDGQVESTSASEAVGLGSIPESGQSEDFRKLIFTASQLGVQH